MKKLLSLFVLSAVGILSGCSSDSALQVQLKHYSGGNRMGDATSFYWYTENLAYPFQASDYIVSNQDGWYRTHYQWSDNQVREILREGEVKKDDELVPLYLHLRFNGEGEAVYQQYKVDGRIRPLQETELKNYLNQAEAIAQTAKSQSQKGLSLIQGVWDGEEFETCDGDDYDDVEFNKTLPSFVIDRLSRFDNYLAFLGSVRFGKVYIEELLLLDDEDHDCIEPFEP